MDIENIKKLLNEYILTDFANDSSLHNADFLDGYIIGLEDGETIGKSKLAKKILKLMETVTPTIQIPVKNLFDSYSTTMENEIGKLYKETI